MAEKRYEVNEEKYVSRKFFGEELLLSIASRNDKVKLYSVDKMGTVILDFLREGKSEEAVINTISTRYPKVKKETIEKDVSELLSDLLKIKAIKESRS